MCFFFEKFVEIGAGEVGLGFEVVGVADGLALGWVEGEDYRAVHEIVEKVRINGGKFELCGSGNGRLFFDVCYGAWVGHTKEFCQGSYVGGGSFYKKSVDGPTNTFGGGIEGGIAPCFFAIRADDLGG